MGVGALCAGAAAGTVYPWRFGCLSTFFMEVRDYAGTDHL